MKIKNQKLKIKNLRFIFVSICAMFLLSSMFSYPANAVSKKAMANKIKRLLEYTAMKVKTISGEGDIISISYGKKKKKKIRFYAKHPNKMRVEFLYPKQMKGALIVTDGETLWRYIPALKKTFVVKLKNPEQKKSKTLDQELGFISELVSTDIENFWEQHDLVYLGEDKVGKRPTYVVELILKKPVKKGLKTKQKLWVDKKTGVTLKIEFQVLEVKEIITFKNIKINQKISDKLFVYKEKSK